MLKPFAVLSYNVLHYVTIDAPFKVFFVSVRWLMREG